MICLRQHVLPVVQLAIDVDGALGDQVHVHIFLMHRLAVRAGVEDEGERVEVVRCGRAAGHSRPRQPCVSLRVRSSICLAGTRAATHPASLRACRLTGRLSTLVRRSAPRAACRPAQSCLGMPWRAAQGPRRAPSSTASSSAAKDACAAVAAQEEAARVQRHDDLAVLRRERIAVEVVEGELLALRPPASSSRPRSGMGLAQCFSSSFLPFRRVGGQAPRAAGAVASFFVTSARPRQVRKSTLSCRRRRPCRRAPRRCSSSTFAFLAIERP